MKRKIKKVLVVLLIMIGITFPFSNIVLALNNTEEQASKVSEKDNIVSLYCWDIKDFNLSKLKDEIEYLKVNTLYIQASAKTKDIERLRQIMEFAKIYNLDVFLLDGGADWFTTGDINNAKGLIDLAYEINKTLDYKIKGVSLDVEFYGADSYRGLTEKEKIETFRTYIKNNKECCDYAKEKGLGYSMALPVWLNKLSENGDAKELEDLMNYDYDHIAFMNYAKKGVLDNLDEEVEIAKRHNIKIVSITEVQKPDYETLGKEDTFYYDGLQKAIDTLNEIKNKYNYENLGTSYHYYKPLVELLERDTNVGIENRYELEVYPYKDGNSIKVDEVNISSDNETFRPIEGFYSESGEYVLNFYGLEYGKEYTITLRSGDLTATKTFVYKKGDKDLDEMEIAYTDINLTLQTDSDNNTEQQTPDTPNDEKKDDDVTNPPVVDDDNKDDNTSNDKEQDADTKDDDTSTNDKEQSDNKNNDDANNGNQNDDTNDGDQKGDVIIPPVVDEDSKDDNISNNKDQSDANNTVVDSNKENKKHNVNNKQQVQNSEKNKNKMTSTVVEVPNTGIKGPIYMDMIGIISLLSAGLLIKFGLKTNN